ncbi:HAD-IIA family hydrolase [Celerinatantimonas yamalensis]|uniref:HAD hydrolase-like protein n=1 Tax=Celerinatantimonas yamalensis TaxID=559956 RepID=A0ABW9G2V1_9GAMM
MIDNPKEAFDAYLMMPERMPSYPHQSHECRHIEQICELVESIDLFLFDGYGVLNVGTSAIPGAVEQISRLQHLNKAIYVLTNAATQDMPALQNKYEQLGFNFKLSQIVNSREVMLRDFYAQVTPADLTIGVMVPEPFRPVTSSFHEVYPNDPKFWQADLFLFLSGQGWNESLQTRWIEELERRPRPIWLGNADLIAPLEQGVSHEPGSYTLTLPSSLFSWVHCYGKPYAPIFEYALAKAFDEHGPIARNRILMVGDTLHTDILGGASMGIKTALVTGSGFLRGLDADAYIKAAGIVPDYQLKAI